MSLAKRIIPMITIRSLIIKNKMILQLSSENELQSELLKELLAKRLTECREPAQEMLLQRAVNWYLIQKS